MVAISLVSAGLFAAAAVNAAPMHQKRIAQVIADSTTKWVAACTKAGGKDQCSTISQAAFTTLLAAGKNCDQQDQADKMIDLAKQLNNDPDMIKFAQIFAQQPRNAPDSLQVPYCQTAPKNTELNGFFHCQFQGTTKTPKFSGDQTGNLPLGVQAVNPPGSCPASKTPVADGAQLTDTVTDPGTPEGGSGGAAGSAAADAAGAGNSTSSLGDAVTSTSIENTATDATASATDATAVGTSAAASSAAPVTSSAAAAAIGAPPSTATDTAAASPSAASFAASAAGDAAGDAAGAKPFTLSNGQDAQKANAKSATAKAGDACTEGSQACIGDTFAQCVGGKLQASTPCSGGTQCFTLPLVNKAGTSVTCDSEADAAARIAATGATGGITGSG